jgi:hypothetical protein
MFFLLSSLQLVLFFGSVGYLLIDKLYFLCGLFGSLALLGLHGSAGGIVASEKEGMPVFSMTVVPLPQVLFPDWHATQFTTPPLQM